MPIPHYTVADIRDFVTRLETHFDAPLDNPRPSLNHDLVFLLLFKEIRSLRQRVADLEQAP